MIPNHLGQVLQLQKRLRLVGAALILVGVGMGLSSLWAVSGLLWWMVFTIISGALFKFWTIVAETIVVATLAAKLSSTEVEPLEEETLEQEEVSLEILNTGEVIGSFKDCEIYQWIEFADGENSNKAFYIGTIEDESNISNVPSYSIVMPPGIIYQFDMGQDDKV